MKEQRLGDPDTPRTLVCVDQNTELYPDLRREMIFTLVNATGGEYRDFYLSKRHEYGTDDWKTTDAMLVKHYNRYLVWMMNQVAGGK